MIDRDGHGQFPRLLGPPLLDQVRDLVTAGLLVYKGHPRRLPTPIRMLPGDKTSTDFVAEQRR